jgi:hypothetical protein
VVGVQVRHDDHADVLGRHAGGGQVGQQRRPFEHGVVGGADPGVEHDREVTRTDDEHANGYPQQPVGIEQFGVGGPVTGLVGDGEEGGLEDGDAVLHGLHGQGSDADGLHRASVATVRRTTHRGDG